jgi:hypothetical protein
MRTEYAARLYHHVGYQHPVLFSEHTPIHTTAQYATTTHAPPKKPHHVLFLKHTLGKVDEAWRPYLFMD